MESERETLYFAYGSNMDAARMAARVPRAAFVGTGRVYGLAVAERLYADLTRVVSGSADGVLWRLPPDGLDALDRYEGAPHTYRRIRLDVRTVRGWMVATAYVLTDAARRARTGVPYPDWYRAICSAGACAHGLRDAFAA